MFETNDFWLSQQHSPLESSALRRHMNAPVKIRQHEVLSASINPCKLKSNLGVNEFGFPCSTEKGLALGGNDSVKNSIVYPPTPRGPPGRSPLEQSTFRQRKFIIFDQSCNETRIMFSSLRSGVQNMQPTRQTACPLWNPQMISPKLFDAYTRLPEKNAITDEQMCAKKLESFEAGSDENENLDEECDMREDTEEINALLYSDDYGDQDDDFNDEDDDEVSSGHSPLIREVVCHKEQEKHELNFDDEVAVSSIFLKRRKILDGVKENVPYENIHAEDSSNAIEKELGPSMGNKRPRKDKIRDTLKVLESMIPGLKSKDPVLILDEAISYLQRLKCNAETMFEEDSDNSTCCEPIN